MKSVVAGLVTAMSDLEANRLELHGDLSELRRLAEWINARAPHVISTDTLFAVQLSLEEAVANIIMHVRPFSVGVMLAVTRAFHLISRSARESSVGGISRLRALAVLRLITNSNLVGRSTGKSPGFAP